MLSDPPRGYLDNDVLDIRRAAGRRPGGVRGGAQAIAESADSPIR